MMVSIKARKLHSLQGETPMLNPNKMRGHEKVIFWILTVTTIFGGLIYLGYLGIVYRMDRADPAVGPQILAREATIKKEAQERHVEFFREMKSPMLWGPIAILTAFALIGGSAKPAVQPTRVVQATAPTVSDGCDLAGAIPNCKAIVADFVAKGVKGTGNRMEAAKPAEHASWLDKPIMSDKEWAAFQRDGTLPRGSGIRDGEPDYELEWMKESNIRQQYKRDMAR
jgi:hypothetical protein